MESNILSNSGASGNNPNQKPNQTTDPTCVIADATASTPATSKIWTLPTIREYYCDRVHELQQQCSTGTPWVFLNSCMAIEYLSNLGVPEIDRSATWKRFIVFVHRYMSTDYGKFEYRVNSESIEGDSTKEGPIVKTRRDLPLQIYCVLRSASIHSFSMIPEESTNKKSYKYCARPGSIAIAHSSSNLSHLSLREDSAILIAESFTADIAEACELLFDDASKKPKLEEHIKAFVKDRPPMTLL